MWLSESITRTCRLLDRAYSPFGAPASPYMYSLIVFVTPHSAVPHILAPREDRCETDAPGDRHLSSHVMSGWSDGRAGLRDPRDDRLRREMTRRSRSVAPTLPMRLLASSTLDPTVCVFVRCSHCVDPLRRRFGKMNVIAVCHALL